MRKKIILVTGDPNSINSELIYKSWKKLTNSTKSDLFLISNFDLLSAQFRKLNYNIRTGNYETYISRFKEDIFGKNKKDKPHNTQDTLFA